MKKVLLGLFLSLLMCTGVYAANSSCTVTTTGFGAEGAIGQTVPMYKIDIACVGDDANGDAPNTNITTVPLGYRLVEVLYNHGSPAPTDNTDVVLNDANGVDLLGGAGANIIDATTHVRIYPLNGTTIIKPITFGTLTQVVASEQAVNSAQWTLSYIFERGY